MFPLATIFYPTVVEFKCLLREIRVKFPKREISQIPPRSRQIYVSGAAQPVKLLVINTQRLTAALAHNRAA